MSTFTTSQNITSIAIGGFDGIHVAHQELFKQLDPDSGAVVAIETGYARMTPGMERQYYTHHPVIILDLDTIRHLDAEGFIDKLKQMFPKLTRIVVGYDFQFGKARAYGIKDLKKLFEGEIVVVDEVVRAGISVHSRTIRTLISEGVINQANKLLGHDYTIKGSAVKGQGIGKKEMVPTINIVTEGFLLPKEGVYATLTRINDEAHYHPSVSFLGHRMTTDGSFAIESHILNQDVGEVTQCDIAFLTYLRDNKSFDSIADLKVQIDKDIEAAKKEHGKLAL